MLDLLIAANKDGLIDDLGIREEVDTFTFEVNINLCYSIDLNLIIVLLKLLILGTRYVSYGFMLYYIIACRTQRCTGKVF